MKALVIDGYIDEPTNLGVPPYLSTYPRYIAGSLSLLNYNVEYLTIDQLRLMNFEITHFDVLVLIAGFTVPGKYLGGIPIKLKEIHLISELPSNTKFLCGPLVYGYSNAGGKKAVPVDFSGYDHVLYGNYERKIFEILSGESVNDDHYSFINKVATLGSFIYKKHPNYPYVISEIETSKGCDRKSFCSYCTEFLKGTILYRKPKGIVSEIESLYQNGCKYFRLGKHSNILSYMGPKPNIFAFKQLYSGIHSVAPELKVLHSDNANSLFIKQYPKQSAEILQIISDNVTPGDVLPFGIETFDSKVIKDNNLKTLPEDSIKALKMVYDIGGYRVNGIPKLLPGLNLLFGLASETKDTYKINLKYLRMIYDMGILLRRINIRKVVLFEQTPLFTMKRKIFPKEFDKFKSIVRDEIDRPMLKKVFPVGTILKDVIIEKHSGNLSFGRQLGSYPILVGVYGLYPLKKPIDVVIVDYGFRSISAFKYPIYLNELSLMQLRHLPNVGKKRAEKIYFYKSKSLSDILKYIEDERVVSFLRKYSKSN